MDISAQTADGWASVSANTRICVGTFILRHVDGPYTAQLRSNIQNAIAFVEKEMQPMGQQLKASKNKGITRWTL